MQKIAVAPGLTQGRKVCIAFAGAQKRTWGGKSFRLVFDDGAGKTWLRRRRETSAIRVGLFTLQLPKVADRGLCGIRKLFAPRQLMRAGRYEWIG